MSVDTYIYAGFYLKGDPKTVEIASTTTSCDKRHKKRSHMEGKFCGKCGTKFVKRPTTKKFVTSFVEAVEEFDFEDGMSEEDAVRLNELFHELPSNSAQTNILLFDDERTASVAEYEEETDMLWLMKTKPEDVFDQLVEDGTIDLLLKYVYDEVEIRFGVVQGWA